MSDGIFSWDVSDDFFGSMFDINGDGEIDFAEQALEFAMIDDLMKEEEDEDKDDDWP